MNPAPGEVEATREQIRRLEATVEKEREKARGREKETYFSLGPEGSKEGAALPPRGAASMADTPRGREDKEAVRGLQKHLDVNGVGEFTIFAVPPPDVSKLSREEREAYDAIQAFEKVFRRRVVFFQGNVPFRGAVNPNDPSVLFLKSGSKDHPWTVLGHELLESIKVENPDLYRRLEDELRPLMKELTGDLDYFRSANKHRERSDLPSLRRGDEYKEVIADFLGDSLVKPTFLERLSQESPHTFFELVHTMTQFIKNLKSKVQGYGSNRYFKDLQRAEDRLIKILAEYAHGESKPSKPSKEVIFSPDRLQPSSSRRAAP